MKTTYRPKSLEDLSGVIAHTAVQRGKLELRGGGSKAEIGSLDRHADILEMSEFAGVVDYDPQELVLTVGAGTPLDVIERLVSSEGQALAFDPFDHGPIFGRPKGAATIGGIIAAGVSGSRRLSRGAVRDHLLGFTAISGRGEVFVAGGKVVKNVTGYDLPKLACGSWGRLMALTEVTLKVLPSLRGALDCAFEGLGVDQALPLMSKIMGSNAVASAVAHRPGTSIAPSTTVARLEGLTASLEHRAAVLGQVAADIGITGIQIEKNADAFWNDLRTMVFLGEREPIWKINIPQRRSLDAIAYLEGENTRYIVDWAGALIWCSYSGEGAELRRKLDGWGGHAMLVRAGANKHGISPALHPQPAPLAGLEERIRRAFDPAGVFESGRF